MKREVTKVQKIRELESNSLNSNTEQLNSSLKSKKLKNTKLKRENQEFTEQIQRMRNELNAKRLECSGLVKRLQEDSGRYDSYSQDDKIEDVNIVCVC